MDYDGDGDLDILSGSYTGEVYLFVRDDDGSFQQGVFLKKHDGGPLKTGTSITPEVHDLDGDGDLDLLIGTRTSGVFWHENLGTRTEPSYAAKGTKLLTRGNNRINGSNAHYADWDHDGVRDLVLGSEWGDVVWHKNVGTNDKPVFAEVEKLIDIRQFGFEKIAREDGPTHPGSRTKVHVADWNGDGRNDLLVGDVRWLYYTETPLTEAEEKEKAELEPKHKEALDTYMAASRRRSRFIREEKPIPPEVQKEYDETKAAWDALSKKMQTYRREKTDTHGYVWLYLRDGDGSAKVEPIRSEVATAASVSLQAEVLPKAVKDTYEITLRLKIDPGWHTYAEVPEGSGYTLTHPFLELPRSFEMVAPFTSVGSKIPATDGSTAVWFVDEVVFRTTVRRRTDVKANKFTAKLPLQVCDDQICLPPTELVVSFDLGPSKD